MTDDTQLEIRNGRVLGAAAAIYVPMVVLLAKGIAPVFALTAVAILASAAIHRRSPLILGPVSLAMAVFAGWALITWFWSISPHETAKTGLSLAATLLGGALLVAAGATLQGRPGEFFRTGLIVGGAAGFLLIAFEFASDAWLTRFLFGLAGKLLFVVEKRHTAALNTGMAATALFFWPWAMAARQRFPGLPSTLAIAAALGLLFLSDADAVAFGLAAGIVVWAVAYWRGRLATALIGAIVAVGVLAAPAVPGLLPNPLKPDADLSWLSNSAVHRLIIWRNAVRHIKDNPVLGGGFDTTRALYSNKDKVLIQYPRKSKNGKINQANYEPIPLHPHNGVLQVWLEMGAVGAVILLVLLLCVVRAIDRHVPERTGRATALGLLTTTLCIGSISFGAWQSWWLTSILLAAAFMVGMVVPAAAGPAAGAAAPPSPTGEIGGPKGPEPTRYGDWERKGRAVDF